VVVISPDKGLCGGLNTNLIREAINYDSKNKNNIYLTVGKKTESTIISLQKELIASFKFGSTLPTFEKVLPVIKIIDEYFLDKKSVALK